MAAPVQPEWISFLASTEIFHNLGEEALRDLAGELESVDFAADETVFRQGDPGDSMYLIVSGQVSVLAGPEIEQKLLAVLGPAREVGELALWTGDRRSATVRTIVPSRTARLTRKAFDRFAERHPEAVPAIDRHVGLRLRQAQLGFAIHVSGLFSGLEEGALRELEARLEPVWVEGGSTVCRQGEAGDALYIVVSGMLQAVVEPVGEAPRAVAELGRGETFGEMALVENEPRSATVRAIRDSQVARLSRADFELLLARYPQAMTAVLTRKLVKLLREQIAGQRRPRRALSTIAVVPASADAPVDEFRARLAKSLAAYGRTLELNAARLDAYLGAGAAEIPESQASHGRIIDLLGKLEVDHRYVIYQADAAETAWTARCLRQSDLVLIVGSAGADPRPCAPEMAVARALRERGGPGACLVLLHPDGSKEPTGTSRWLTREHVDRHYHIRMDLAADFDRLARSLTGRGYGLVLGGGAARGFAHAGVIRALREAGVPIDMVGGTSAGAVFSVVCALGWDYDLSIKRVAGGFFALMKHVTLPLISLLSGADGVRYMRGHLADMQMEDLWLPCFAVSANLTRASVHVHRQGDLVRSLLASSRLPAILPPILWDGDLLVDGGIIDNVPVDVMRGSADCGTLIACDVSPTYEPPQITPFGDWISGWHALRQLVKPATKRKRFPGLVSVLMRTMDFGGAAHKSQTIGAADLYLTPPVGQYRMNDFKKGRELAETGYLYAAAKIAEWLKSREPDAGPKL